MSHSVRRHLRVDIDAYDETIRRFIPGYDAMLRVAAAEVVASPPGRILDLGAGTGALSEAILEHDEVRTVELIEIDPEMLARAEVRLAPFGERVRLREASFHDALPRSDGVAASLALHHVPTIDQKRTLYRRVHDALRPGGVFVNADAVMPADAGEQEAVYRLWADHMVAGGIAEARAFEHFEEWAEEDAYFPLQDELAAMRAAGFKAECAWHEGPVAVIAGRKEARGAVRCGALA